MPASTDTLHIDLAGGRGYAVQFAPLAHVPALLQGTRLRKGRCLVVTDTHVGPLYAGALTEALREAGWQPFVLTVEAGEASKDLGTLAGLYDEALAWGPDRQTPVLALGGGVVGDLAGFLAATLLRGVPLVQLPTTIVAQVDSALGGKTGINHRVGKNLIGAFWQPRVVVADTATLATLPDRERHAGLAEVVKHGLIADADLLDTLEHRMDALLAGDEDALRRVLPRAAAVKARIVGEDEREASRRAVLNFGHTFGHAIEHVAGYGTFAHGEAVAVGMRAALHLSRALSPALPFDRLLTLVDQLPVQPDPSGLDVDALMEAMQHDKKVQDGRVRFVLLHDLGRAYITDEVDDADVRAAWRFGLAA